MVKKGSRVKDPLSQLPNKTISILFFCLITIQSLGNAATDPRLQDTCQLNLLFAESLCPNSSNKNPIKAIPQRENRIRSYPEYPFLFSPHYTTLQIQKFNKQTNHSKNLIVKTAQGLFNAIWDLIKLALFAPISIASNIAEGTIDGINALFKGDIVNGVTWPLKVALNAGWNTAMIGLAALNIVSDPLLRTIQDKENLPIRVMLIGAGPRLRTLIQGGPLSYLSRLIGMGHYPIAFTLSSAFIQAPTTPDIIASKEQLGHEFGHTLQLQNSFLIDVAINRAKDRDMWGFEEGSIEDGANRIRDKNRLQHLLWIWF